MPVKCPLELPGSVLSVKLFRCAPRRPVEGDLGAGGADVDEVQPFLRPLSGTGSLGPE